MKTIRDVILFALNNYPDDVLALPARAALRAHTYGDTAPHGMWTITLEVPKEVVQSLRGGLEERTVAMLLVLPSKVVERAESPILLPTERLA